MVLIEKISYSLINILPFFLFLNLIIFIFATIILIKKNFTRIPPKKIIIVLFILFIIAIFIRILLFPNILYNTDDLWSINTAQNFVEEGKFYICQGYSPMGKCEIFEDYDILGTNPFFYSIFLTIFDIDLKHSIYLMIVFGSLSIIAIFFLIYHLYKNYWIAVLCAYFLTFNILHCALSSSSSTRITSVLMLILTFLFSFYFEKKKKIEIFILMLASYTFLIQTFPEYIAIIFLFPLIFKDNFKEIILTLKKKEFLITIGLFLFLNITFLFLLVIKIPLIDAWFPGEGYFSIEYLKNNLPENFYFYFLLTKNTFFTINILTYISILSFILALKNKSYKNIGIGIIILFYFFFYSSSELGSFYSIRYNLTIIPLMIILSGYFLKNIAMLNYKKINLILGFLGTIYLSLFIIDFYNWNHEMMAPYHSTIDITHLTELKLPKENYIIFTYSTSWFEAITMSKRATDFQHGFNTLNKYKDKKDIKLFFFVSETFKEICFNIKNREVCQTGIKFYDYIINNYHLEFYQQYKKNNTKNMNIYELKKR